MSIEITRNLDSLSDDVLLDDKQIAALTGISIPTLKRWRALGTGPVVTWLGDRPRVRVADYRAFLAARRRSTETQERN
jgi:hypothetical protein